MRIEAESNNPFQNPGDSLRGRYMSHHVAAGMEPGKTKLVLTVQTKAGEKSINCPTNLRQRIEAAANKGLLKPNVILVMNYERDENVGKPKPMKVITLDIEEGKAKAPPPPPEDDDISDADADIGF